MSDLAWPKLRARIADLEAQLAAERTRSTLLAGKLQRIRDWLKYKANSNGGIVAEIDDALRVEQREPLHTEGSFR